MAVYSAFIGALIGLVWSFAINFQWTRGLKYGGIAGFILGLFMAIINDAILKRGNLQRGETGFAAGSLLSLLLFVGVGTGLLTWLIRAIFF
jgi:hypothetical protein